MTNTRRELPEPAPLWRIFENICSIPHPSGHEKALAEALSAFARERGLAVRSDSCGNLRIDRPASPGFEGRPAVILQAHLDMVPQAERGSAFDFTRDPIPTVIEDGWMRSAAGTTLGADDGIGVAAALALLTDEGFRSGPLAAVFTLSEEVGLNGAVALDPAFLKGDFLLNLDSEDEGELFIGCAGGARLEADLPIESEAVPPGVAGALLEVKGLAGGHSGCNIADRRGNALLCVANFTPVFHPIYRIGLPYAGVLRELMNTDRAEYGGSDQYNAFELNAVAGDFNGFPYWAEICVPPLSCVYFTYDKIPPAFERAPKAPENGKGVADAHD